MNVDHTGPLTERLQKYGAIKDVAKRHSMHPNSVARILDIMRVPFVRFGNRRLQEYEAADKAIHQYFESRMEFPSD